VSESFGKDFRRFFRRGLTAVLPTLLTLAIIVWVFTMIQDYIGQYINTGAKWVVVQFMALHHYASSDQPSPAGSWWKVLAGARMHWDRTDEVWRQYRLGWVGFVLAFVAIYIFGRFATSFLGRRLWRFIEGTFKRTPVVRQIYPHVKQVTDFLLSQRKHKFSRVVAVEYPRKGVWSVGLVTGSGMRTIQQANDGTLLTVFIPSSPTPITGYTIIVRRDEVIDLPLSIDDALRFTVSGGVIMPPTQRLSHDETERATHAVLPHLPGKETTE